MTLLAQKVQQSGIAPNVIIGPAMGGVILAYEMARQLCCQAMYTEKDGDAMALKRGFTLTAADRVLVVEDAVSTGGSVSKALAAIRKTAAQLVGVALLFDRTMGQITFDDLPVISLLQLDIPSWDAADCPLCRSGMPLIAPKA